MSSILIPASIFQCGKIKFLNEAEYYFYSNAHYIHAGLSQVCYKELGCVGEQIFNGTGTEVYCCDRGGRSLLHNGICVSVECPGMPLFRLFTGVMVYHCGEERFHKIVY